MARICIILFFLSLNTFGKSILIEGKLLEASSRAPIAYANIGIVNKNIGTISNPDGTYNLRLDSTLIHEKITFSALGYERKSIAVQEFVQKPSFKEVLLDEKSVVLEEISINHKLHIINRIKHTTLGNEHHNSGTIRLDTARAGGSMALLLQHDEAPFQLNTIRIYIPQNSNTFKVRVRCYNVDPETGAPGEDLIEKNIIINSDISKGWLKEDLSSYNIWIKEKEFFLAFEWIMDSEDRKFLAENLLEFIECNPESIYSKTTVVDGQQCTDTKIKGFKGGTWFGTTFSSKIVEHHECYFRTSSLSSWQRSAAVLTAMADICF